MYQQENTIYILVLQVNLVGVVVVFAGIFSLFEQVTPHSSKSFICLALYQRGVTPDFTEKTKQQRNETGGEGKKTKPKRDVINHTTTGQSKQTGLQYLVVAPSTTDQMYWINDKALDYSCDPRGSP